MDVKYYELMYNYEKSDNYIYCDESYIGELDRYCITDGIKQENWKGIWFEYDSKEYSEMTDYVSNVLIWLIISDAFYQCIADIPEDKVQFLPVTVRDRRGIQPELICQAVNVLDVLEGALDLGHSVYDIFEVDDEKVLSVEKYALKKEVIEGHDIFKLQEDTIPIFVSERIKKIIQKNKFKGFSFLEVKTT